MEVVDQSEIRRQFIDHNLVVSERFIVSDALLDDHVGDFYGQGGEISFEEFFGSVVVLLEVEQSIEETRHSVEELPILFVEVGFEVLIALEHSFFILSEKGDVSGLKAQVHATDPNGDLTHIKGVAILASFMSQHILFQTLVLFLCCFEVEVRVGELVHTFISHDMAPRRKRFAVLFVLFAEVVMEFDEHDEVAGSPSVGRGVFLAFMGERSESNGGRHFDVVEEFL